MPGKFENLKQFQSFLTICENLAVLGVGLTKKITKTH